MSAILEIQEVTFPKEPPYDCGLSGVSIEIREGEIALVELPVGVALTPLADAAEGLIEPAEGRVLFEEKDWRERSPDLAATARGRIGRVFERAGWLSNLDLDENITLAGRYHSRETFSALMEKAEALAAELKVGMIPQGRPARMNRETLLKAQWIRALLGSPRLLLLERPVRDLPAEEAAPFVDAVRRRCEQHGLAVLWITDSHERLDACALRADRKYAIQQEKLVIAPV
ncbi:MAG: hypothetical protein NZ740_08625 [Kiritimatiellae bacterium]|nr:hypothetical protein [Kiritimatiellia bacterium]MDW8459157.1 hypothetical protein [Verrucomicrobiota bacterium]